MTTDNAIPDNKELTRKGDLIQVEVAYALPTEQVILSLNVPQGTTVDQAMRESGILERFPEIDADQVPVGIFGKAVKRERVLSAGDRVEIYRPLIADPKVVRKERAQAKKEALKAAAKSQPKRNRGSTAAQSADD